MRTFLCFSGTDYKPSYYRLTDDEDIQVCLATGFSKYHENQNNTLFSETTPVRISEDSLFNQLAFISSTETACEGKNSG